jgi:hypothetical protein
MGAWLRTGVGSGANLEISERLFVGDVVEMRKLHPCGGLQWRVERVGADIGLICLTCKRRVLMPRRQFARQTKKFIQRGADEPGEM